MQKWMNDLNETREQLKRTLVELADTKTLHEIEVLGMKDRHEKEKKKMEEEIDCAKGVIKDC